MKRERCMHCGQCYWKTTRSSGHYHSIKGFFYCRQNDENQEPLGTCNQKEYNFERIQNRLNSLKPAKP